MARDRMHIICGNCGCNDEFSYRIEKDEIDNGDNKNSDDVYIVCGNCSTLHSLDYFIERQEELKKRLGY
jgi:uncharacterized Zn finger protein